jgi:hypothetical protein
MAEQESESEGAIAVVARGAKEKTAYLSSV